MIFALVLGALLTIDTPKLVGYASLPADTTIDGPTSGQFITPANGRTPPFDLRQPVQGITAFLPAPGNRALVLSDNGYGTKANSPDYVLSFHSIRLDFKTRKVIVERTFSLSDPNRKTAWPILAEMEAYPDSPFPVDATLKEGRLLTGWDFDTEAFQQVRNGTFWFGDEFGPFLLNTDVAGRLLRSPIPLPGVFTPDNPLICTEPNLSTGKGIKAIATDAKRRMLYAILGGSLASAPDKRSLVVHEFDSQKASFTGRTWSYRLDEPSNEIGGMAHVSALRFLIVEHDTQEGLHAQTKKVYLADLATGAKREVANLLLVADPSDANGDGNTVFTMPFRTIGGVAIKDSQSLIVWNDNDFPFSSVRFPSIPDRTEFALLRLPRRLNTY